MADIVRSKTGPLPPAAFDQEYAPYDPKKIDQQYSADYLRKRDEISKRVANRGKTNVNVKLWK